MASNKRSGEPSAAPPPDVWYNLALGSSFKDHNPSSKFCTLRYEFKPASIDKNQTGTLTKNKDNRVTVEFQNNQHGKPKVTFEGSSEDYKENDAVLFFDGESFRLERLHRAVKRLRHVRQPGESTAAAPAAFESSPPPLAKQPAKFQSSAKPVPLPVSVEVERIDIGDFKSSDQKPRNEKPDDHYHQQPISENTPNASPEFRHEDLEEQLDILNDDDDDDMDGIPVINREITPEKEEYNTGIDINIPHHQSDIDNEIADIDDESDDDEVNKGNAAEALRAQVNAEVKHGQSSTSSGSSASESSGSGSASSSSSSSDSDSSDGDSVNSV